MQDVTALAESHISLLPRAPRARLVFTGVPHLRRPCLQQHLLPRLTAFACGNLCCRRGGPMERSALGRKLHLSLQRKGGSPTGFRLLRAVFSSQLCQLLTTMPSLENRTKHYQRYQKKDLKAFSRQKHNSIDLAATSAVAIVRNRAGWVG